MDEFSGAEKGNNPKRYLHQVRSVVNHLSISLSPSKKKKKKPILFVLTPKFLLLSKPNCNDFACKAILQLGSQQIVPLPQLGSQLIPTPPRPTPPYQNTQTHLFLHPIPGRG